MTPHYLKHVTKPLNFPLLMDHVKRMIYTRVAELDLYVSKSREPVPFGEIPKLEFSRIGGGERWGQLFDCAWFLVKGRVPEAARGKKLALILDINGEGCVYDRTGRAVQGITCGSSVFDRQLGNPVKRVVPLSYLGGGPEIFCYIDAGNNDLFGTFQAETGYREAYLAEVNDTAREFWYDAEVLWQLLNTLEETTARYQSVLGCFDRVLRAVSATPTNGELAAAGKILREELAKRGGDAPLTIHAVGHSHLDLAWLWPIRETRRKAVRTVATQLRLLERYNGYVYNMSQPQMLAWLRQDAPPLYDEAARQIAAGRIELQGGSWVEFDTYMPSGESMVRQFLYGKRFVGEEFGRDMEVLWLPDAFGYSAALPQIAAGCGMKYFMTIKLSWSAYDAFPFSSFRWQGTDGSELLAHMPPENTYNGAATAASVRAVEANNKETAVFDRALMLFGIGDGGGGPGTQHLEYLNRLGNLAGLCPVVQSDSMQFFRALGEAKDRLPVYRGELYVQNHQGTLTTVAMVKRCNRTMERKLRETEALCTLAALSGASYPANALDAVWQETLLYQFHDILPGSSIRRVYEECEPRYREMESRLDGLCGKALDSLRRSGEGQTVWNFSPYSRTEPLTLEGGEQVLAECEALSNRFRVVESGDRPAAGPDTLENSKLKVRFHPDGSISSMYSKELDYEGVRRGGAFNRLAVYADLGDAWDMSIGYANGVKDKFRLENVSVTATRYEAVRECRYSWGNSTLTQRVRLAADSELLVFDTEVDYQEPDRMLRAEFDVNLCAEGVDCDMQFGSYRRPLGMNTSAEFSRFEVCAHKFATLSGGGHSFSLLNDCKFGYHAAEDAMSLNLIRVKEYPGGNYDLGRHRFTYAVCLTPTDPASCRVEQLAYALNNPLYITCGAFPEIKLAATDRENVVVETMKRSEDGEGVVWRVFENRGLACEAVLTLPPGFEDAEETDLLEGNPHPLSLTEGRVALSFRPHEVKTVKARYKG